MSHFNGIFQFIQNIFSKNKTRSKKGCFKFSSSKNVMYFPCLNCGNLIQQEQIDSHSQTCVFFDKNNFSLSPLESSNFKLRKIYEHLNEQNKVLSDYYFNTLSIYITLIISTPQNDEKCIDKLKAIITNINSLLLSKKCQLDCYLQIIMEKVKILIIERIIIIKLKNQEIFGASHLSSQNETLSISRIETISTFIGNKERFSLITLPSKSNKNILLNNQESKIYDNNKTIQELYKDFLKSFLKFKFKFSKNIFLKQTNPKELFLDLIDMKIPCSEWKHCIYQMFNNKYNKAKNLNKMDTINEEE